MTFLVFDTETTGLFRDHLPVDDPLQPHVVQLAAQLCHDDGKPISGFSFIVDTGVPIPEAAAAIHGITDAMAATYGVAPEIALDAFQRLYHAADLIVAHNLKFDRAMMEAMIARRFGKIMRLRKDAVCTMEKTTDIIRLPPSERMKAAGIDKFKPPRLEECIRFFFCEDLAGAHDAEADMAACKRVFLHLQERRP